MVWLGHGHRMPEPEHWQIKLHHCCRHMLARLQPARHDERHVGLSDSIGMAYLGRDSSNNASNTASSVSLLDMVTCSAWGIIVLYIAGRIDIRSGLTFSNGRVTQSCAEGLRGSFSYDNLVQRACL